MTKLVASILTGLLFWCAALVQPNAATVNPHWKYVDCQGWLCAGPLEVPAFEDTAFTIQPGDNRVTIPLEAEHIRFKQAVSPCGDCEPPALVNASLVDFLRGDVLGKDGFPEHLTMPPAMRAAYQPQPEKGLVLMCHDNSFATLLREQMVEEEDGSERTAYFLGDKEYADVVHRITYKVDGEKTTKFVGCACPDLDRATRTAFIPVNTTHAAIIGGVGGGGFGGGGFGGGGWISGGGKKHDPDSGNPGGCCTPPEVTPVPLPAAAWLLLAGLGSIVLVARRKARH